MFTIRKSCNRNYCSLRLYTKVEDGRRVKVNVRWNRTASWRTKNHPYWFVSNSHWFFTVQVMKAELHYSKKGR